MKRLLYTAACLLLLAATACTDEESGIGVNLVDGNTLYNGHQATLTANRAISVRDSSLQTSNYSYGIIGNYQDAGAVFGKVSSVLYTQIALDNSTSSINMADNIIDSVVLTLVKERTYPDSTATYNFHFEVMQLATPLRDTVYYCYDTLPVNPSAKYFDQNVSVGLTDSVVRLKLDNSISTILNQTGSAEEFLNATNGLRIRITDAGSMGMLGINFSATKTCLTVYHRYSSEDTVDATYTFQLGSKTVRFTHFEHDYSGSATGGADSLDGSTALYIEPLGGYNILVSFDSAVHAFVEAHPTATIHYAELLVPVTAATAMTPPDRLLAVGKRANGTESYIDDLMMDVITMARFDGTYDATRNCYRLRVTQHLQGMLREGADYGLLLVHNSRRSAATGAVINGLSATDHIRIELTYTE
ncbi:MAG: DUF4270 family protein [Bacteroidales bacterium]|nr:DUF4270 family protein [Bacteroidales bacterium]